MPNRQVILLAGPSGSGKSTIARACGLPTVNLDDFYRDGDDPALPMQAELGIADWDHPDSWNQDAALSALASLCREGRAELPIYDIAQSRAMGSRTVTMDHLVIAEGLFAPRMIEPLRALGLLADAIVVHRAPWKNFVRRLARDLQEARKPPHVLIQRGRLLLASERGYLRDAVGAGCRALDGPSTRAALATLRDRDSAANDRQD